MTLLDQQTRYIYLVRSEVADIAEEADWNRWYDEEHIPDLLSVPGIHSATRYERRAAPHHYLAAYEIDSPAVFDEPRYKEVGGWRGWDRCLASYQRAIYEIAQDLPGFSRAKGTPS